MSKKTKIVVYTPQFKRTWRINTFNLPISENSFINVVSCFSRDQLIRIGFCVWDDDEIPGLLLIPVELFNVIPNGFPLVDIFGVDTLFDRETHDKDVYCGCLAYGIIQLDVSKME